ENVQPAVASGFTGVIQRVVAGEFAAIIPCSSTGIQFMLQGAPVAIAPLSGAPTEMRSVALATGAPHPNAARLFLDWMTTPEGSLHYFDGGLMVPTALEVRGKSKVGAIFEGMGIENVSVPSKFLTEENTSKSADWWMEALGVKQ
ncbi:hypothetical protein ACFLWB_03155, partial [Chloroflexota bacterium]